MIMNKLKLRQHYLSSAFCRRRNCQFYQFPNLLCNCSQRNRHHHTLEDLQLEIAIVTACTEVNWTIYPLRDGTIYMCIYNYYIKNAKEIEGCQNVDRDNGISSRAYYMVISANTVTPNGCIYTSLISFNLFHMVFVSTKARNKCIYSRTRRDKTRPYLRGLRITLESRWHQSQQLKTCQAIRPLGRQFVHKA